MTSPESEFFIGKNRENPEVSPTSEDLFSSKNQGIGEEQAVLQPETQSQETLFTPESHEQVETQSSRERELFPSQETIKDWLQRQIKEAEEKGILTEEKKKKLAIASTLWLVNGIVSTAVGGSVLVSSTSLWRTQSNPLFLLYNLLPGVLRLGTIVASEKLTGVKFSQFSKALSLWPTFPAGWAMPYEAASTLGKRRMLFAQIKNRYLTSPLTSVRSAFQDFFSVFKDNKITSPSHETPRGHPGVGGW